jgi:flavin-dependent dehydrogenase
MSAAVVIGGGLAAGALATRLARAGRKVIVFERDVGPVHKVCGEFLSREAWLYLRALGLDLPALGAVPIDAVRVCLREHVAAFPLPFGALSLSRRTLDHALLEHAASCGAWIRRGTKVKALLRAGAHWRVQLEDGSAVETEDAFLATGKHDLRGHRRPRGLQNDLVAFKLHLRLAPTQTAELTRHVELVLFDGGYVGLELVEDGVANLCALVRRHRLQELGPSWEPLLATMRAESPHLDRRLAGAEACWSRPLALSAIPYGHVRHHSDGPWRLGDQAAVIPSFSGDGMSIALHSAELAATTYLAGKDTEHYQRRLAHDVRRQVLLASLLSQGLVRRPSQAALLLAARLWPSLVSAIAFHTRVPDAALRRASLESLA